MFKPNVEKLKEKGKVKGLIKALKYSDPKVFKDAAEALGQLGDSRAVDPLIKALVDGYYKSAAAKALGQLGDSRAVDSLIEALGDTLWPVQEAAAYSLGQIGDARAAEPLIRSLWDENKNVRKAAEKALKKLGNAAVEVLIKALEHQLSSVRKSAAKILGEIGWKPDQDELGALYWITKGDFDKCVSIGAPAVDPLIKALGDVERAEKAAKALGQLGDARAFGPLIKALDHMASQIRSAVAKALGQLGDARAVEPLIKTLGDKSEHVRKDAAEALDKLGNVAVDPLIKALGDEEWMVRKSAAHALDEMGWKPDQNELGALYWIAKGDIDKCVSIGAPAVESLVKALGYSSDDARRTVAGALDEIGWKPDKEELGALYWLAKNDFDKCVSIGAPSVELLINKLNDSKWNVREAAIEALGQIGDARAVDPLIKVFEWSSLMRRESNWAVKKAAARALAQISSKDPAGVFKRWNEIKTKVETEHEDEIVQNPSDCASHHDEGIGIPFPDKPKDLDF